jgi:hypothetical protein
MTKRTVHSRLLAVPYYDSLFGAQLEGLAEERHGKRTDFLIDYHELRLHRLPELVLCDGRPYEQVQGDYVPRRLRFRNLRRVRCTGAYAALETLPADHGARCFLGAIHRDGPGQAPQHIFFNNSPEPAGLLQP